MLAGMKSERFVQIINIISTSVKQPIPGLGVFKMMQAFGHPAKLSTSPALTCQPAEWECGR